ncbi:MAG: threonine--tRNA ligase [Alphaproteobacteria bacterium TMED87]|nr:threonine--tRNA ligase [Rhodospirillaceae bacterium]OUV09766.1 MAG: threonine--tRNA ligase [Alphaproteobacteria bacterium TMED87]
MVLVSLPDGSERQYTDRISGYDLAKDIGPGLAKSAIAMSVNGVQRDLGDMIESNSLVSIITIDSDEGLEIMRHTIAAQVLALAIKRLYPNSKLAIGPTIENGFYYDVLTEPAISLEDLSKIEKEMNNIVQKKSKIEKTLHTKSEAINFFHENSENYKIQIIEDSGQEKDFQIYKNQDAQFIDLCRGPHLPSLSHIGSFKLTKVAGAYWRGDSNNEMFTRIYGTAWRNNKELKAYLSQLEEAEKRDHRKIGKQMDLFHLQEEAQGSVFWHPRGYVIWLQLENYIRNKLSKSGYEEVKTPQLISSRFWEKSGHWSKFRENMFVVPDVVPNVEEGKPIISSQGKMLAIKPMNCPAHVQIYNSEIRSYKDLPIRLAEFGCCHRNEPHGALHGLMRVRQMTQDDAHIFCREDQVTDETIAFCDLLMSVYKDLGFNQVEVKLATRPDIRAGDDSVWDRAEKALEDAVKATNLSYEIIPGEGAFYGPKLEFHLKDAIGRKWQCGTIQLDFVLPDRLSASYIGADGNKHKPVMLHRAILGSLERFIGILIESYAGKLPLWLAPVQVVVATITSSTDSYAKQVYSILEASKVRVNLDLRNEKINYKIRDHSNQKIPIIAVVGEKESDNNKVALRRLGGKNQEIVSIEDFVKNISQEIRAPDY